MLCDVYIFVYISLVMACVLSCLNKRIWRWWWSTNSRLRRAHVCVQLCRTCQSTDRSSV